MAGHRQPLAERLAPGRWPSVVSYRCRRAIPCFFLFGSLLLLFAVFSQLSLLPTKANKASKNPKDYIIK